MTALGGKENISNETDLDLAVLSTCVLPPHGKLIFSPSQEDFFGPFYTTYGRSWVSMDETADSVLEHGQELKIENVKCNRNWLRAFCRRNKIEFYKSTKTDIKRALKADRDIFTQFYALVKRVLDREVIDINRSDSGTFFIMQTRLGLIQKGNFCLKRP